MKTFWMFTRNIDRMKADDDIRRLQVNVSGQSGEMYQKAIERLTSQLGDIVRYDLDAPDIEAEEGPDQAGLDWLRSLAR